MTPNVIKPEAKAAFTANHSPASAEPTIRPLKAEDGPHLKAWTQYQTQLRPDTRGAVLEKIAALPPAAWQAELSQDHWTYFGLFQDDALIGMGKITLMNFSPYNYDTDVEVKADFRGQGLGTKLYQAMTEYVQTQKPGHELIARIRPDNPASLRAAQKAGFVDSGKTHQPLGQPGSLYKIFKAPAPQGPAPAYSRVSENTFPPKP